jgi:hypothetical protein
MVIAWFISCYKLSYIFSSNGQTKGASMSDAWILCVLWGAFCGWKIKDFWLMLLVSAIGAIIITAVLQ